MSIKSLYNIVIDLNTNKKDFESFVNCNTFHFHENENENNTFKLYINIWFNKTIDFSYPATRVSKNIYFDQKSIYLKHELFDARYTLEGNSLNIKSYINISLYRKFKEWIKTLLIKKYSFKEHLYFHLVRELITLPFFWSNRIIKKPKFLMHASVISMNNKGYVFLGNDGVGKTTIALNLLEKEETFFLGDNFTLYDNQFIYQYTDNIRLNKNEIKRSQPSFLQQSFVGKNRIYHNIIKEKTTEKIKPSKFFLIEQSNKLKVKKITTDSLLNSIFTINDFVKEFDKYSYISAFNILSNNLDKYSNYKREYETCENLLKDKECYLLYLPKSYKISDLIKIIS